MLLEICLASLSIVLLVFTLYFLFDEYNGNSFIGILLMLAFCITVYGCNTNESIKRDNAERGREKERENIVCRTPKIVSEINGITLYSFQEDCHSLPVYFSKSGTQHEVCHIEGSGKTHRTVCEQKYVPNTESSK